MVKQSDFKDIVSAILSELKGRIHFENLREFETKLEVKAKQFELQSREIADGLSIDISGDTSKKNFTRNPVKFVAFLNN